MKDRRYCESIAGLARLVGYSKKHLGDLRKSCDFPSPIPGKGYDVAAMMAWLKERRDRIRAGRRQGKPLDVLKADKLAVEIDTMTLKLKHHMGQLVAVEEFRSFVREVSALMNEFVDRLVNGISAKLRDPEALRVCEQEAKAVRQWFEGKIAEMPVEEAEVPKEEA